MAARKPAKNKRGLARQPAAGTSKGNDRNPSPREEKDSKKKPEDRQQSGLGRVDDSLLFVLGHQLRVRILAALNEEDGSASDLRDRLNCSIFDASYHLKILRQYDHIELVREARVGSAIKKIYRAKHKVHFPTEVWKQLPPSVQQMLVAAVFLTSFSDAELALSSRAFELRPESHASWSNLDVDERAFLKLIKLFDRTLEKAHEIEEESKTRVKEAGKKTVDTLTVSINMSAFVLPEGAEEIEGRMNGKASLRHRPEDVEGRP